MVILLMLFFGFDCEYLYKSEELFYSKKTKIDVMLNDRRKKILV
jgi:hypothetical protein